MGSRDIHYEAMTTEINDVCRARIRQMREKLGFSRPVFADRVNMTYTTIKSYELGYRTVSLAYATTLAKQFPKQEVQALAYLTGLSDKEPE